MTPTITSATILGAKDEHGQLVKGNFVPCDHNHEMSEVNGLQEALNVKATTEFVNQTAASLNQSIAGKANQSHNHPISGVTGLQASLDHLDQGIDALEANKANIGASYTKAESDAINNSLTEINDVTGDVDSNNPFDLSAVNNGTMHHLHTSANSITLASCVTSSISGTDIKFLGAAGSTATRDFVIRKYRLGNHFIVELIAAY